MQGSGGNALVEFTYVSNACRGLPAAVLMRLARHSWSHNTRNGLTGVLRFDGSRFEQTLEGPGSVLLPLAARILADPRHEAIRVEGFRAIPARRFANWTSSGFDEDEAAPFVPAAALAAGLNLFHLPAPGSRLAPRALEATALGTS
jgi:hypothetical protein